MCTEWSRGLHWRDEVLPHGPLQSVCGLWRGHTHHAELWGPHTHSSVQNTRLWPRSPQCLVRKLKEDWCSTTNFSIFSSSTYLLISIDSFAFIFSILEQSFDWSYLLSVCFFFFSLYVICERCEQHKPNVVQFHSIECQGLFLGDQVEQSQAVFCL